MAGQGAIYVITTNYPNELFHKQLEKNKINVAVF